MLASSTWADPSISVCWLWDFGSTERGWVEEVITERFNPFSGLDITFMSGTCPSEGADVVIDVSSDYWPAAAVGQREPSITPNFFMNFFTGPERDLSGDGDVDFSGLWDNDNPHVSPATGRSWSGFRRYAIEAIAVHEMAHILGILHEEARDDIFWYAPGSTQDYIWYGNGNRGFTGVSTSVNGTYQPVSGDFNGDSFDDIYWYNSGFNDDPIWWGAANGIFSQGSRSTTLIKFANPTRDVASGDFNGDGIDDLLFSNPTGNLEVIHQNSQTSYTLVQTAFRLGGIPVVGDFDGNGFDDIVWK